MGGSIDDFRLAERGDGLGSLRSLFVHRALEVSAGALDPLDDGALVGLAPGTRPSCSGAKGRGGRCVWRLRYEGRPAPTRAARCDVRRGQIHSPRIQERLVGIGGPITRLWFRNRHELTADREERERHAVLGVDRRALEEQVEQLAALLASRPVEAGIPGASRQDLYCRDQRQRCPGGPALPRHRNGCRQPDRVAAKRYPGSAVRHLLECDGQFERS